MANSATVKRSPFVGTESSREDSIAPIARAAPIELTVVIPTFNERTNVPLMVERLNTVLTGIAWEVVFVDDDSPDGTADSIRDLARREDAQVWIDDMKLQAAQRSRRND